jgi:hypothetical protein
MTDGTLYYQVFESRDLANHPFRDQCPKLTIDKVAVLCELYQCLIAELAQADQTLILQADVNLD